MKIVENVGGLIIQPTLIILKVYGIIDWSWPWVLMPFILTLSLWGLYLGLFMLIRWIIQ